MFDTASCQNCKRPFHISHHERAFLEHLDTPLPTFCPACRLQRRLAFRNERSLYERDCDLCGNRMISMYAPDREYNVYCPTCFYSDRWDPISYGRPYDMNKSFFAQFLSLQRAIPRLSIYQKNAVNSPKVNYELDVNNCHLDVGGQYNENCAYNQYALNCKNCFDNYWITNSDLCYESLFCEFCYKTWFSIFCFGCSETYFSFDCRNCSNIIGCSGLNNKKYYIFNQFVGKEKYEKFLRDNPISSHLALNAIRDRASDVWKNSPQRSSYIDHSASSSGQMIQFSNKCNECYAAVKSENVRNGMLIYGVKNSMDVTSVWSGDSSYELIGGAENISNVRFSTVILGGSHDIEYSDYLYGCSFCFGCINLQNKSYCILNKQYSRNDYFDIISQKKRNSNKSVTVRPSRIQKQMSDVPFIDRLGHKYSYGEFFPYELSPFAYNETIAQEYFPLEKEIIKKNGYLYSTYASSQSKEKTYYEIPDRVEDVNDDILDQVLECKDSGKTYTIIPMELEFYRQSGLPIPQNAPFDRHRKRVGFVSSHHQVHVRKCAMCRVEISSVYRISEFPNVCCNSCYAKEVYDQNSPI